MRGTLPTRLWTAAVIVCAALGVLAWPWIAPRIVSRRLDARITLQGEGPVMLRWATGSRDNGVWLDFDDPGIDIEQGPHGSRTLHIRQWLPSYGADEFEVVGPPGSRVSVSEARVESWMVGARLPTLRIAETSAPERGVLPPLQPVWRSAMARGVATSAVAGAAIAGLAWGAWAVAWRLERRRSPGPSTGSRASALTAGAVLACIALPLLMALWAPMLVLADSTAYIWLAQRVSETGSWQGWDGWRMPGYALLLLPFIQMFDDYATPVGLLQAAFGAGTALLVLDMLRSRVPRPWPQFAAVVTAGDPILLGWQRVLMGESLSALLITMSAWLFLRIIDRASTLRPARALLLGLALGAVSGAACLVRGNNQVVPVVLVAGLVWCGYLWKVRGLWLAAAPAAALSVAMLLPLCVLNQQQYGRFAPAVGRDFTRALFSWENSTTDWNQSGMLSFEEFRELRTQLRSRPMTDWDVLGWLASESRTVSVPEGAPRWLAMELMAGAQVNEAVARQGPGVSLRQFQSFSALMGFPIVNPDYALDGTWAIFMQLRAEENPRTTTNFDFTLDRFPPEVQPTIARAVRDISWTRTHPAARVYGAWFDLWRWLRAGLAMCFIASVLRLVFTGRWAYACIGLVVLANCIGVPVLTYAAEYRYAAPFYPLVAATIALGLFSPPARNAAGPRRA